jgi:hypothetical protein
VCHIGAETQALIRAMNAEHPAWIEGYSTKLLDGNCIEATERRIKPLRLLDNAALLGKSRVVFDPQTEVATAVFPCEEGHAQECSLFNLVLKTVKKKDLWVADRNFCTQAFLFGIHTKKAAFIIREHQQMPVEMLTKPIFREETETGKVYEQTVRLKSVEGKAYLARRILVKLYQETGDGEKEICILTNLTQVTAKAANRAERYRNRGGIETAFQRLASHFHSKINSLGSPKTKQKWDKNNSHVSTFKIISESK